MTKTSILDIKDILGEYSKDLDDYMYSLAKDIANKGVREVKNASPTSKKNSSHKGRYKRGWTMSIEKGFGTVQATIHNKTDYQLTHLLERPHIKKNQYGTYGTTYPKSEGHISKVEQQVVKDFETELESRLKNGL